MKSTGEAIRFIPICATFFRKVYSERNLCRASNPTLPCLPACFAPCSTSSWCGLYGGGWTGWSAGAANAASSGNARKLIPPRGTFGRTIQGKANTWTLRGEGLSLQARRPYLAVMTTTNLWTTDDVRDALQACATSLRCWSCFLPLDGPCRRRCSTGKGCVRATSKTTLACPKPATLSGWKAMCHNGRTPWGHAHRSNHGPRRGHRPQNGVEAFRALMPMEVATLFVAMISAYVLGLCLGLSPWVSLALGIGFGLSSVNILYWRLATHQGARHRHHAGRGGGHGVGFRGKPWRGAGVAAVCGAAFGRQPRPNDLLPPVLVGGHRCRGNREAVQSSCHKPCGLWVFWRPRASWRRCPKQPTRFDRAILAVHHPRRGRVDHPEGGGGQEQAGSTVNTSWNTMSRGEFWSMAVPDVKAETTSCIGGATRRRFISGLGVCLVLGVVHCGQPLASLAPLAVSLLAIVLSWAPRG